MAMTLELSRRKLLKAGGLAIGGLLVPGSGIAGPGAAPAAHSFKVGEIEITVLSDGRMSLPQSFVLPEAAPEAVDALFASQADQPSRFDLGVNAAIIRSGDRTVLVDTGGGTDFMPGMGRLPDVLTEAGIPPESITDVVFTHAHPDHFWGVIDPFDEISRFSNARHFMASAEIDFWLKPDVENSVPVNLQGMAIGTQRRLKSVKDQISNCKAGDEIAPGVHIIDTAGHTPGHLSVQLASKGEELFIGGDVLAHPLVSFAEPKWKWGSDMDWESAVTVRLQTLDMLSKDRVLLFGYHLPWPGVGRVKKYGGSYRFIAVG